jgi:uncharacterized protein YlxW (UPF0749 family)
MLTAISNINLSTGYQVQQAVLPEASTDTTNESQDQTTSEDRVTLSRQAGALEQAYSQKKSDLEQDYVTEVQELEREYEQDKKQLEKELSRKKQALGINLYA